MCTCALRIGQEHRLLQWKLTSLLLNLEYLRYMEVKDGDSTILHNICMAEMLTKLNVQTAW